MSVGIVPVGTLRFTLRPWTRLARASSSTLLYRVTLELDGVPAHAWSARTARTILSPGCWVEHVEAISPDRVDMTKLKVQAWTDDPSRIPRRCNLWIEEREVQTTYDDPVL